MKLSKSGNYYTENKENCPPMAARQLEPSPSKFGRYSVSQPVQSINIAQYSVAQQSSAPAMVSPPMKLMLLPSKPTRMISITSPLQVSNKQNVVTLQHSTAQGAQNRPNVQYPAAHTAQKRPNMQYSTVAQNTQNTRKISNSPPPAQTAKIMPNVQCCTVAQGVQNTQNTQNVSILPPSNSPIHQIQLRGTNIAGSRIFFPQDSAQNRSNTAISKPNVQYSTAKTAQSMPKVQYSAAQTAQNRPTIKYSVVAQGAQNTQMISLPKIQLSESTNQILVNNVQYSAAQTAQNRP